VKGIKREGEIILLLQVNKISKIWKRRSRQSKSVPIKITLELPTPTAGKTTFEQRRKTCGSSVCYRYCLVVQTKTVGCDIKLLQEETQWQAEMILVNFTAGRLDTGQTHSSRFILHLGMKQIRSIYLIILLKIHYFFYFYWCFSPSLTRC